MSKGEYHFKISVVGDGAVGKTSLIKKYTKGNFEKDYIKTIGAQFSRFEKLIENDYVNLDFWDIAGQEDFDFLQPLYYKESKASIVVYSLEENELGKNSLKHIKNWVHNITKYCGNIPIILFANKIDLVEEKELNLRDIKNIVDKYNFIGFSLTSAKTGQGVDDAFNLIIQILYNKYKD